MTVGLQINPAKQGENVADVYLLQRDGALQQVPEVTARLLPEGRGSGALDVAFRMAEPGHFVASPLAVPTRATGRCGSRSARRSSTRPISKCRSRSADTRV